MGSINTTPINLSERFEEEFEEEKFKKLNSNCCSYKTDKDEEKTIWQQMSINYFYKLLKHKTLYFKCLEKYSKRDERSLKFYKKAFYNSGIRESMVATIINDFSHTAYISCWYKSKNLTDIVFKEYAKGSVGVAISTQVGVLKNTLRNHVSLNGSKEFSDEIFYGDVIYLDDESCKNEITNSSDLVAPLFIKSENHNDDKEFRLVYVKNSYYKNNGRFSGTTIDDSDKNREGLDINIEPKELIQKIAVRDDDPYTLELTKYLFSQFWNVEINNINCDEKIDGFTILKI